MPVIRRDQPRMGEDQPDQQRLLLAGRAERGRHVLLRVAAPRNRRGAGRQGAAGGAVAGARAAPSGRVSSASSAADDGRLVAVVEQRRQRQRGRRESSRRRRSRAIRSWRWPRLSVRAKWTRRGVLGHLRLDGGEPERVGIVLEQPVALAHGLVVVGDRGGMAGDQRRHQPVEEAAAVAGGAGEEPVHRRGEPEQRGDSRSSPRRCGQWRR